MLPTPPADILAAALTLLSSRVQGTTEEGSCKNLKIEKFGLTTRAMMSLPVQCEITAEISQVISLGHVPKDIIVKISRVE